MQLCDTEKNKQISENEIKSESGVRYLYLLKYRIISVTCTETKMFGGFTGYSVNG